MILLFVTLAVFSTSILASVVVIYARRMSIKTRRFWAYNLAFFMARQFLAFIERVSKTNIDLDFPVDFFRYCNYCLSIITAIYFMYYIHKRYSKEQHEIDLTNAENY